MPSSTTGGTNSSGGGPGIHHSYFEDEERYFFERLKNVPGNADKDTRDCIRNFATEICYGSTSQDVDRTSDALYGLMSEVVPRLLMAIFLRTVPSGASQENTEKSNTNQGNTNEGEDTTTRGNLHNENTNSANMDEGNEFDDVYGPYIDEIDDHNGVYTQQMGDTGNGYAGYN